MWITIDNDNVTAWSPYKMIGATKEVSIEYDDYVSNPGKYVYNTTTQDFNINPKYNDILLEQEKELKTKENDTKRDKRLASGIEYKGIMFDCDTDQKANLLGVSQFMEDGDSINWWGMDNKSLLMSKADMLELGQQIAVLTNALWAYNANVKYQIEQSKTVADVKKIFIDYDNLPDVESIIKGKV